MSKTGIAQINEERLASKQESLNAKLTYLTDNPHASLADIAAAISRSRSTAGNYVNELVANGRLHKNGQGWEIVDSGD